MNSKLEIPVSQSKHVPIWVRKSITYWWAVGAAIVATYWVANQLRGLIIQLLLALFLAFAMGPVIDKIQNRGLKRGVATGATMLAVLVAFGIFMSVMGALVVDQLQQLVSDVPEYTTSISGWLANNFDVTVDTNQLEKEVQSRAGSYVDNVANSALDFSGFVVGFLFQLLTVSLFAFYFAAEGPKMQRVVCSFFPPAKQSEFLRIWQLATDKTSAYISSRVVLAIAATVVHWIAFYALGIPSSLALALWVGIISQFVPVIGTYIAGVLPLLVALANEPVTALWVIAIVLVYQQIENYVLQPRITAQTLNMHPAIAFGGVLAGSSLLGATGAVLALPIVATVQAFGSAYVERHNVIDEDQDTPEPPAEPKLASAGS